MNKNILIVLLFTLGMITFSQGASAVELDEINWKGFISQGYMWSNEYNFLADTKGGTFQFNEVGLTMNVNLSPSFYIGMQTLARNLGDIGDAELRVDWAQADYRWKDWLGIRVGIVKIPYGLYNEIRNIDALYTGVWLPTGVYNESFRDAYDNIYGGNIYGYIFVGNLGILNYQLGYGTKDFNKNGGAWKMMEVGARYNDINKVMLNEIFTSSLIWSTPLEGLRIGGTFLSTNWTAEGEALQYISMTSHLHLDLDMKFKDTLVMTGSVEYTWGDLVIAAEYMRLKTNIVVNALFQNFVIPQIDYERILEGFYVSAAYSLTDSFEFVMSYAWSTSDLADYYRVNDRPIGYNYRMSDYCIGGRFDINENWLLKAEIHAMDGTDAATAYNPDLTKSDEATNSVGDYDDQWWYLFAAKISYTF